MTSKMTDYSGPTPSDILLGHGSRKRTRPIYLIKKKTKDRDLEVLTKTQRAWLNETGWEPKAGSHLLLPDGQGSVAGVLLGLGEVEDPAGQAMIAGVLPRTLPEGGYHFESDLGNAELAALSWVLGAYRFDAYRSKKSAKIGQLKTPDGVALEKITNIANAVFLGRDLINTPANDLGPAELEAAVRRVAKDHKAVVKSCIGDDLLKQNFPMIHAVGRASDRAPRLIDFSWGSKSKPKVTLVGKGICFDTGGLNIKPGDAMRLMKKDMGGSAAALSLASMIMSAQLPVRLRLIIPSADNNISANAFRPGDVLKSRNGMTVEIGNTDAEGRLVLADGLALADEEKPDILLNFATLTGSARVALGPELPPFYTDDDAFAEQIESSADAVNDPLWRMPFWMPYNATLASTVADVSHISDGPFAGSITAALFLKRFVQHAARFAHFDIFGWVPKTSRARVRGGEPQGARALFDILSRTYPS